MSQADDKWDDEIRRAVDCALAETLGTTDPFAEQHRQNYRLAAVAFPLKYYLGIAVAEIDRLAAELDGAKTALCESQMQTLAAINVAERAQAEASHARISLAKNGMTYCCGKILDGKYAAARAANTL